MPVHIGEMTSEVTVADGELPLSETQLDKLVKKVLERLAEKQRENEHVREATELRRGARPPLVIGD